MKRTLRAQIASDLGLKHAKNQKHPDHGIVDAVVHYLYQGFAEAASCGLSQKYEAFCLGCGNRRGRCAARCMRHR